MRQEESTSHNLLHTSVVKKPVALNTARWMRINSLQGRVFVRSGAGGMPWRLRMLPTV
jgi:hypothetical protein